MVSSNKFNLKLMKINGLVGFAYFGYAFKEKMVEKQWKQRMSLFQTGCDTITVKYNITNFLYNIFSYVRVMRYSTYSRTVFKIYKNKLVSCASLKDGFYISTLQNYLTEKEEKIVSRQGRLEVRFIHY